MSTLQFSCASRYDTFRISCVIYHSSIMYDSQKIQEVLDIINGNNRYYKNYYKSNNFHLHNMVNSDKSYEYFNMILDSLYDKKYVNILTFVSTKPSYNLFKLLDETSSIIKLRISFNIEYLSYMYDLFKNLHYNYKLSDIEILLHNQYNPGKNFKGNHLISELNNVGDNNDILDNIGNYDENIFPKNIIEINKNMYEILMNLIEYCCLQKIKISYKTYVYSLENNQHIFMNIFNKDQLENIDKLLNIPLKDRRKYFKSKIY